MSESSKKMPSWLRYTYMTSGVIASLFALLVMFSWYFEELIIVFFLGVAMLIISITRLLEGAYDVNYSTWNKVFNIIISIILLPIAVVLIARLNLDLTILIIFLAISLMLLGVITIVSGFESYNRITWFRIYLIVNGFALIACSYLSIILGLVETYLLMITGAGYLLLGIRRFIEGYFGIKLNKPR